LSEGKWLNITDFPDGWRQFNKTTNDLLEKISENPMTYLQVEKWFEERFHGRKQGIKNGINVLKKLDLIEDKTNRGRNMI
jgi:hypothetical protein